MSDSLIPHYKKLEELVELQKKTNVLLESIMQSVDMIRVQQLKTHWLLEGDEEEELEQ